MSEVTAKVWNGIVHVRIVYQHKEYLLSAKRVLYFPSYFRQIADFFLVATGPENLVTRPVWLEYEKVPLKWNLPIGLLHDLLYSPGKTGDVPWTLSMKLASEHMPYPSEHVIPFQTDGNQVFYEKLLSQILLNALKQACYVLNGSSRAVMNLSQDDTLALCRAMDHHDLAVYGQIRRKLAIPGRDTRFRIPLKIYVAGSAELLQAPVWSKDESGNSRTLGEVIVEQIPGLGPGALPDVYIHGINVDILLKEPLLELWTRFHYMDNFLYVVLAMKH